MQDPSQPPSQGCSFPRGSSPQDPAGSLCGSMHRETGSTACMERGEIPKNDRSVAINKCNMEYHRDPSVTEGSVSLVEFGNREKTPDKQTVNIPVPSSNSHLKAGG